MTGSGTSGWNDKVRAGVITAVALPGLVLVFYAAWRLRYDVQPPIWAWAIVGAATLVMAIIGVTRFVRSYPQPVREPYELTHSSIGLVVVIACAIGFGFWGIVDGDSYTPGWIGGLMLVSGLAAGLLLVRHLRKPVTSAGGRDE